MFGWQLYFGELDGGGAEGEGTGRDEERRREGAKARGIEGESEGGEMERREGANNRTREERT